MNFTEYQLKYIAGLIDADGNIDCNFRNRINGYAVFPKITIAQKNIDFLLQIRNILNSGYMYKCGKNCNVLEINSKKAFDFLHIIEPFLVLKKDRVTYINQYSLTDRFDKNDIEKIRSQFLILVENEKVYVENYNISWFAGFIDGDGCFLCEKQKNCTKPRFRLAISYHKKYDDLFKYLTFGKIRTLLNNTKQWYMSLNTKSQHFLNELYKNLLFKKYQALTIYTWLEKYPTNKKLICTKSQVNKIHTILKEAKECILPIKMYQFLARSTAIYPIEYRIIYPTMGLAGETGEVCEKVKKILRDDNGIISETKRIEIKKEISDILWYMANLAEDLNLDLDDIAQTNIDKLRSRQERNVLKGSGDNR